MYIKEQIYRGKLMQIIYPEDGYVLQHKETKLVYGSVSLEDGRKKEDFNEIKEQEDESSID